MPFKELEEEHIHEFYSSGKADNIERKLEGTMGFYQFMGNIFELYLVRMADTLIEMSGSSDPKNPEAKQE